MLSRGRTAADTVIATDEFNRIFDKTVADIRESTVDAIGVAFGGSQGAPNN